MTGPAFDPELIAADLLSGDRRALARGITLVESTRDDHRRLAETLLGAVMARSGDSIRLGISGVPGVGKSTFIEAFGGHLIAQGHRVAVLAVDPSSARSRGSILGDKTRMELLARNPSAFIRPSPAAGTLGGVARRTREAMLLCEAAGFDVVIVETVGVGQSETAVADMVDMFLLLLLPAGGDELQGIKKGIVELADLIVVNKADGELDKAANRAVSDYRNALALIRAGSAHWKPPVLRCSALEGTGIEDIWQTIGKYRNAMAAAGQFQRRRAEQARAWMWNEVQESLMLALRHHPAVRDALPELESRVLAGDLPPALAARDLVARFLGKDSDRDGLTG
ncbi:methylmalonyl Co-A mutase-associated GTPase MeaB [Oceanibaculum pacificum]|uniref:Protein kinase n=1 Tax=Oceanibaculum pacificum TaxID=580166 RepID=A0A154V6M9_9PROT|nr:methylmalonyl Co-A mutase-associated GTPase MeaB [Oceanibaculum pacificum]KZC97025.1 protein kinase [Oceanibaculum pacificum]